MNNIANEKCVVVFDKKKLFHIFFAAKRPEKYKIISANKILDSAQFNPTFHLGNSEWYHKFFTIPMEIVASSLCECLVHLNAMRGVEAVLAKQAAGGGRV